MSETWFTSDTHFGHANIIKYSNRPFASVDEMDEALIRNWNNSIKPEDTVYHLGDFAFSRYDRIKTILRRLNGTINLCLGNHDKDIIINRQTAPFYSISSCLEVNLGGQLIVMNHYAHRVWNKSHRGSIHLYGHSHGSLPPFGKSVDIGVDCKEITSEYRPIHLDEVIAYMNKRAGETIDHHGK